MLDESCLNKSLFVKPLFIFQNFESYIFTLLVIITFKNNTKRSFSKLLGHFKTITKVLIHPRNILIALGIKTVICCLIKHPHLGLCSLGLCIGSIELLLLPFLDWKEVNSLVLKYLSLLNLPKVRAEDLECIISRHRKPVVVVRGCRWVLLVSQRRQLGIDQLVFVGWGHSCRIQRHSGGVGCCDHVGTELHWLLDGLRGDNWVASVDLSNSVQVIVQVVRVSTYSVYWSWIVRVVLGPGTGVLLSMRSHDLHRLVVGIDGPWLSSAFFEGLGLVLQSLSVLLIGLYKLNFLLWTFVAWWLICRLLVLESYLFLS